MFSKMSPRNGKVVKRIEPTADMNEVEECIKSLL
jgi:glutathione peroxidase-family protein